MNCEGCVYCRYPRVVIGGERAKKSLVIVGEAPGITEIARKQFFTGPSGQLLRETMKKVGLPIEDTYLTNAMLCLPPKGKQIKKEAVLQCRQRLINELKEVQPRLILTMGSVALQSLTGDMTLKITQEQGTIVKCPELPGTIIIPVLHPAKVLRSPGDYKIFHRVMTYAAEVFNGGEVMDPGTVEYEILFDAEGVERARQVMSAYQHRGADIEAVDLNRSGTTVCTKCGNYFNVLGCTNPKCKSTTSRPATKEDILVLGVAYDKNKVFVFPPSTFPHLEPLLSEGEWIWHFGYNYDKMYCKARGIDVRMDHELVLLHYCLNESAERGLEVLSAQFLGAKAYKSEANKYITSEGGFATAPLEIQAKRVAMDCDYTLQLFHKFYPLVCSSPELNKLYHKLLMPAAHFLQEVMEEGMEVNIPQMELLRVKYLKQIEELVHQIQTEVGDAWDPDLYKLQTGAKSAEQLFKPTSSDQLKWLVFDRLQIKPPLRKKSKETGALSLDEEVILSLGNSKDEEIAKANLKQSFPFLADILELRSVKKELSTYVEGVLDRMDTQNRVHSTFTLHITSTGRLSSKDPNVQNIPSNKKDLRRGFQPRPGYIYSENDYKGAELRVLAHVSGVGKLGESLIVGNDLHDDLSYKIWGEEWMTKYHSKVDAEKQWAKNQRMKAKTVNFGIPYGRDAFSIAIAFGVSPKEAQQWIDLWFELYPEAKAYLDQCEVDVLVGKAFWTPYGRCRRFGLINPDTKDHIFNEAKNYRIQSISSDNTLISAMRIQPLIKPFGARVINLIHDSILIEQPDDADTVMRVAAIVKDEMEATPIRELGTVIPFGVDIELGYNWGDIKDISKYEQYKDFAQYRKGVS